MLDLLITGADVITADAPAQAVDLGIRDGRIEGWYRPGSAPAAREVVAADGRIVLPGLIDPHVHPGVYEDLGDDLEAMTRFAALGGITSLVSFHRPQASYAEAIPRAIEVFEAHSYLDSGFILGVTQEHHIRDLSVAARFGVNAFKFYLGYCGHEERFEADFPFTESYLVEVMRALGELPSDPLLCVHCETANISDEAQRRLRDETEQTLDFYDRIHPVVSEVDAAVRVSLLGSLHDVRTCIVHVSAGTTAEHLAAAPWVRKDRTVLETCMHYLAVDTDDPAGLRAVVRPPVRGRDEVERLWTEVLAGTLDTFGSDNCRSVLEEKVDMDVWTCRLGFGELGLTLPLLLSEGVHKRGLPLERVAAMTSTNVARAHGIYPRKGSLAPGADADLVVVDLDLEQTVDVAALKGRPEGSVYAGRSLTGWPVTTVVGGRVVARDGAFSGELGHARFLRATPPVD